MSDPSPRLGSTAAVIEGSSDSTREVRLSERLREQRQVLEVAVVPDELVPGRVA